MKSDQAAYLAERRRYSGGKPLPRTLDDESRRAWAKRLNAALGLLEGKNRTERMETLSAGVGKIREALAAKKAADRQSLAPPVYEIRRVVLGQSGPSPQRVLEFSEGLWTAGIPSMSALVGWSWARPYQAQALAVIGKIAARADAKLLRPMWPGLEYLIRTDLSVLEVAGDEQILTWTPAQHRLIYDAWTEWMASHEEVERLPEPFQIYIAVARIAAVGRSVHGRVVLGAARNAIGEWMREQHPTWEGYETYPTTEEERLLDTMQRA